jgi:pilus assembly protein Flp/PilA
MMLAVESGVSIHARGTAVAPWSIVARSTERAWPHFEHTALRVRRTRGRNIMNFITSLRSFVRNEEGQDLLEYALLVALIAIVAVTAVTAAGASVNNVFTAIAAAIPAT